MAMEKLVNQLQKSCCSLVLKSDDGTITQYFRRGVLDLYILLMRSPSKLKNAWVADKVVGKGAAALMVKGGVAKVHAVVISNHGLLLLRDNGVEVTYDTLVNRVLNHQHTGPCPVEALCMPMTDVADMHKAIKRFVENSRYLADGAIGY